VLEWIRINFSALSPLRIIEGLGVRLERGPGFIIIHCTPSLQETKQSFGIKSTVRATVTLRKGALRYAGHDDAVIADDSSVTITSRDSTHPTWVYLQRRKSDGVVTIECTDTEGGPVTSGDLWCFALYTMYLNGDGNAVVEHDWRSDIRIGTPIG